MNQDQEMSDAFDKAILEEAQMQAAKRMYMCTHALTHISRGRGASADVTVQADPSGQPPPSSSGGLAGGGQGGAPTHLPLSDVGRHGH